MSQISPGKDIKAYLEHLQHQLIRSTTTNFVSHCTHESVTVPHAPSILESAFFRLAKWRANGHGNDHIIWTLSFKGCDAFGVCEMSSKLFDAFHGGWDEREACRLGKQRVAGRSLEYPEAIVGVRVGRAACTATPTGVFSFCSAHDQIQSLYDPNDCCRVRLNEFESLFLIYVATLSIYQTNI